MFEPMVESSCGIALRGYYSRPPRLPPRNLSGHLALNFQRLISG